MSKMRVVQVNEAGGPFEITERAVPSPGQGEVRLRVQACGICHSDAFTKDGLWPGIQYPRIPGHEIAGIIDALGEGVQGWEAGQRVGVGWHGASCGYCESCKRGDFVLCRVAGRVPGITMDGGYAQFMIARVESLARIPDQLSPMEAAPLLCAGITTFNSLRNSGAKAGDLVAIHGIGGLGHLGVQFASKMGMRTVAIARGKDKESLARDLGAQIYIDSEQQDAAVELQKLGGASVILATVTSAKAMSAVAGGLGINGKMMVLGAPHEPLQIDPGFLIGGRRSIMGWPSGSSIESQETMAFAALSGVRSSNEVFPLERAEDGYNLMMSGKARFRVVLVPD